MKHTRFFHALFIAAAILGAGAAQADSSCSVGAAKYHCHLFDNYDDPGCSVSCGTGTTIAKCSQAVCGSSGFESSYCRCERDSAYSFLYDFRKGSKPAPSEASLAINEDVKFVPSLSQAGSDEQKNSSGSVSISNSQERVL